MSDTDRFDRNGLEILSRQECFELLAGAVVGRVGLTVDALPTILPVNFAVLDGDVVIRTAWGAKLDAATHGQVVCFETDGFDPATRDGWSVLVTGRAEVIDDQDHGALLDQVRALPLEPWAPNARNHYVRIHAELVSGRRIFPGQEAPIFNGER